MNGTPKMDFVARILIWHVEKEKKRFLIVVLSALT